MSCRLQLIVLAIFTSFFAGCQCRDEDSGDGKGKDVAKGPVWEDLFDGETLDGWEVTDYIATRGAEVKAPAGDGEDAGGGKVIEIRHGEPLGGIRWKGAELPRVDYEIALEARRMEGDDFFCCLTFPYKEKHASLVIGGWGGSMTGISSVNHYDAAENETNTIGHYENGTWYPVRMRITGERIEAWIGGEQVVNLRTKGKIIDMRFGEIEESVPLGVSVFMTVAEVRGIKLKRLPEGAEPETEHNDEFYDDDF